jgi:PAS domain S-box-containing protein
VDASGGDFGERFRATEQRLQDILDSTPAVVYVKDPEGRYLLVNRRYEELHHVSRAEAVGKTDHEIFPKEVADEFRANDELVLGSGRPLELEESVTQEDGLHTFNSLRFPLGDANGTTYAVCGISTDNTARKQAEETLLDVREVERKRMARDLHDGALQDLAYGLMEMEVTRLHLEDKDADVAASLGRAADAFRHATKGLRAVVNDLRLGEEKNRPLPRLVGSLVERMRGMDPGCTIRLDVQEGFPSGPAVGPAVGADTEVLHVIGEALTNARRHSGARNIRVSLRVEGDHIVAEVSDDGRGFGPETEAGVGLASMRERALRLGGDLAVESKPGEGTWVQLRVPMSEALRDAPQDTG